MGVKRPVITAVLGAGASRSVSYRDQMSPSPLDHDFFDLLQRLPEGIVGQDAEAINFVLTEARRGTERLWDSLEKCFYTTVIQSQTRKLIYEEDTSATEDLIRDRFAIAIQALLRAAHFKKQCSYHRDFLSRFGDDDRVITFNYDLVAERALAILGNHRAWGIPKFGGWIYGFENPPDVQREVPIIYKLHGSSNWWLKGERFEVHQDDWPDFVKEPGYLRSGKALLLPFWDKKIENEPWSGIWKKAGAQLRQTSGLIVWGYSLPLTDLKARELFKGGIGTRQISLCVIDPSKETRQRWRLLFPDAKYWTYDSIDQFLKGPPDWWELSRLRPPVNDSG